MAETSDHPTMQRLLEAAAVIRAKLGIKSQLAAVLGESAQTITNWSSRGVSKQGALNAQRTLGISSSWTLDGIGPMLAGRPDPRSPSQSGRFDPDMVADTVTALLVVLRRRDKSATLDLQNPLDAALFCEAYAELEALEGSPGGEVVAGAVIADLVAIREERRNARGTGGEGQQVGGPAGGKTRRTGAGTKA